jgi:P-type E1-E2 ATPase
MSGDTTSLDPGAFPHPVKLSTGMTSAEKAQAVVDLQVNGQNVLFIGDGLNDAEAISVSTVGLAVSKGDATARIHADGEISMASFKLLPQAVDVARKTLRTVRMILGISLCYNFVGIALACGGVLHPVAAACIMVVSSMTVIAVAARKC